LSRLGKISLFERLIRKDSKGEHLIRLLPFFLILRVLAISIFQIIMDSWNTKTV
jgi:hypothetical protein